MILNPVNKISTFLHSIDGINQNLGFQKSARKKILKFILFWIFFEKKIHELGVYFCFFFLFIVVSAAAGAIA